MKFKAINFAPIAAAVAVVLLGSASAYATQYSVTNLGTLGNTSSFATGVNSTGEVVGWTTNSAGSSIAFLYAGASGMQSLGNFGGSSSQANELNDAGTVAGFLPTVPALITHFSTAMASCRT